MTHKAALLGLCVAMAAVVAEPRDATGAKRRDAAYADHVLVTAEATSLDEVEHIWRLAENVLEPHHPAPGSHRLVITRATLRRLRALGISARVEPTDVQTWIDGLDADTTAPARGPAAPAAFGPFFSKVQRLSAIHAYLDELAALSQGRAEVVVLGRSVQGRDIKAMRISAGPRTGRPAVIVIGTQHAREWASPMVTMGLVDALVHRYDSDPQVRRVVDHLEIVVNPVNNPDGYVATFNGRRLQRRNLNPQCNVDLNRNYDTAWGQGVGSSCGSDTFPGTAPFSEPESQAIRRLVDSLAHPALLFDYHSTAAQVMIPFAFTRSPAPNLARNRELCELYSATLESVRGTRYPARPGFDLGRGAGGGAFDWFRATRAESMVVELGGSAGFGIANDQIAPFAEENFVAWLAVAGALVDDALGAEVAEAQRVAVDVAAEPGASAGCSLVPIARDGAATDGLAGPVVVVLVLVVFGAGRRYGRAAASAKASRRFSRTWSASARGATSSLALAVSRRSDAKS